MAVFVAALFYGEEIGEYLYHLEGRPPVGINDLFYGNGARFISSLVVLFGGYLLASTYLTSSRAVNDRASAPAVAGIDPELEEERQQLGTTKEEPAEPIAKLEQESHRPSMEATSAPDEASSQDARVGAQRKADRFSLLPRWLRGLLVALVILVGAFLLKPVSALGGEIAGALGAAGLVLLVGYPLYWLAIALIPPKQVPTSKVEEKERLEEIANSPRYSEDHRKEAARRLANLRTEES